MRRGRRPGLHDSADASAPPCTSLHFIPFLPDAPILPPSGTHGGQICREPQIEQLIYSLMETAGAYRTCSSYRVRWRWPRRQRWPTDRGHSSMLACIGARGMSRGICPCSNAVAGARSEADGADLSASQAEAWRSAGALKKLIDGSAGNLIGGESLMVTVGSSRTAAHRRWRGSSAAAPGWAPGRPLETGP
ncbi:hypothetical protein ACP4OV_005832 [Aristida adscensionis]